MQDLGWDADDPRDTVELTIPPHDLIEVARRLREEAQGGLSDADKERQSTEEFDRSVENFKAALDACDEILDVLGVVREGRPRVRRA